MKMNSNPAWLKRMAELEDGSYVSAGGWVHALEEARCPAGAGLTPGLAFSQLVLLARKERELSRREFASQADIALTELVRIEEEAGYTPSPRAVHQIAHLLGLPVDELNVLAGHMSASDEEFVEVAYRFAARSTPGETFTGEDRQALQTFVRYLINREKEASR